MRIALCGVQCTGKSTLLKEMIKLPEFKDYVIIYEVVRKMIGKIKINQDGNENTQFTISNAHVENLKYDNVITDRCILDCFAYSLYAYNHGKLSEEDMDKLYKIYLDNVDKYDVIFYIRPEFDMIEDGVRSTDVKFRNAVLENFDYLVQERNNVVVLTGTVEERMNTIMKTFRELKEKNERA